MASLSMSRATASPALMWRCEQRKGHCFRTPRRRLMAHLPLTRCRRALYWLHVTARPFQDRQVRLELDDALEAPLRIVVGLAYQSEVTVTAERGIVSDIEETRPSSPCATGRLPRPPLPTIGNALTARRRDDPAEHVRSGVALPPWTDRISGAEPHRRRALQQLDVPLGAEPVPRVRRSEPGAAN